MDSIDPDLYYKAARETAKYWLMNLDEVTLIEWDDCDRRFVITFGNKVSHFCTLHEAENGFSRVH